MTSVQSYIKLLHDTEYEPTQSIQRKRKISLNTSNNKSDATDDYYDYYYYYLNRGKRKCDKSRQLIHNIRILSNCQYLCYIKKPVSLTDIENMIKQEYLKVKESIYKPNYRVEYDSKGNQIYIEDQTNDVDLQRQIWENINFQQMYSNLAKIQYEPNRNKFSIDKNLLKFSDLYEIPFNDNIKDYSIVQYSLEQDKRSGRINAVVEIFIETENKSQLICT